MRYSGKAWLAGAALVAWAAACGGGSSSPTSPDPPPPTGGGGGAQGTTITIQQGGAVSPSVLTVSSGTRVTFVNSDSRVRDVKDDPHPTHGSCPELAVDFLASGQSRTSGTLTRTCGWHDHNDPDVRGTIVVQ